MAEALDAPAAMAMPLDNPNAWHNFSLWTVQHLAFLNMTKMAPSFDDIVWAGPRMVRKLGSLISNPDSFGNFGTVGQHVIADATDAAGNIIQGTAPATHAAAFSTVAAMTSGGGAAAAAAADQDFVATITASASRFSLEGARGVGSLFSYATSKWALCCVAVALILNRTYIFAATRRRVRLRWPIRLLLRSIPIISFVLQGRRLLQSIQCQTSPDFAELRWGNASKHSDLMFTEASTFLHGMSQNLLLNPTDAASCRSVRMVPQDLYAPSSDLRGSLSLLWPLFLSFCISSFIETIISAIQGRPLHAETGMTIFEHSLAFAEADAAVSNQLGWGAFSGAASSASSTAAASSASTSTIAAMLASTTGASTSSGSATGAAIALSRSAILARVNTPPEVLLLAFLSCMSHITSHVLGVFNLQSRFRLLSTGFWAMCFMGSIVWSVLSFSIDDPGAQSLLRFPTVSIVGFIPHMLVLTGIVICCSIYFLALLLSAVSQEPDIFSGFMGGRRQIPFRERLANAHANMQANLPMGNVRVGMEMDFYTALLRVGFDAITMASEAVYLNEDRRVSLRAHTWLEDERYEELQELRSRWLSSDLPGSQFDTLSATGLVPVPGNNKGGFSTGYSRERAVQKGSSQQKQPERIRPARSGIGASERSGRWLMAVEYLVHVGKLIASFSALYTFKALAWVGISYQPRWLRNLAQRRKSASARAKDAAEGGRQDASPEENRREWLVSGAAPVPIPRKNQVDVEFEVRKKYAAAAARDLSRSRQVDDQEIDNKLYRWWLNNGWWGEVDASGDYEPSVASDDDVTSVISAADDGWEDDDDENDDYKYGDDNDGRRTPTQRSPFASRESSPAVPDTYDISLQATDLARLLDPQSPEEQAEAQALAAHLNSDGILTRAAYDRYRRRQRVEVLASSRYLGGAAGGSVRQRLASFLPNARMTPDEEARLLEQILLSRRAAMRPVDDDLDMCADKDASPSWANGADGLGPDGPQCVVCQSAARTIIVWPCRCLSLCDDCRVSLAMNNFDKCVCCRREVSSFSRIFVP